VKERLCWTCNEEEMEQNAAQAVLFILSVSARTFPSTSHPFELCIERSITLSITKHSGIWVFPMAEEHAKTSVTIYTIGHSTHSMDEFAAILKAHGIEFVIDVRTIPKSRHNPQYNSDTLAATLHGKDVGYEHLPGLGGLRRAKNDSINKAWENASFRGFADYMQTADFERSLNRLIETAVKQPTVIMCAEAVPWRCHRSLIADALLARGITVMDIMSKTSAKAHTMTPWAHVMGTKITYPGPESAESAHEPHPRRRSALPL